MYTENVIEACFFKNRIFDGISLEGRDSAEAYRRFSQQLRLCPDNLVEFCSDATATKVNAVNPGIFHVINVLPHVLHEFQPSLIHLLAINDK